MKKLLLILALCLVPLNVADACPGRKGPQVPLWTSLCNGPCIAPLVAIPDMVQQVLETTASIAENAFQYTNQGRRDAGEFMQRVFMAEDISDTDVQRVVAIFDKGAILVKLTRDDLAQASKLIATATVEEGPVAVALQLRAAAMFTDATIKFNRARAFFLEAEKAAATLLGVEVKNPC